MEVWKTYPRNEAYEASNMGRVRSIDRYIYRKDGIKSFVKGSVLKPHRDKAGRVRVAICDGDRGRTTQVSIIVAETFIGLRADNAEVVRHLNDDPSDNRVENLAFGTQAQNAADRVKNGKDHNKNKTHCKRGHAFTPFNIVDEGGGNRSCKACRRARSYIWYEKNRHLDFGMVSDSYFKKYEKAWEADNADDPALLEKYMVEKDGAPSVKVLEKEGG